MANSTATAMANLSIYILTFNCGRAAIEIDSFAATLFKNLSRPTLPDLLVLSLQEFGPLAQTLLGGSLIAPYFSRFQKAVNIAAGKRDAGGAAYELVTAHNVGMLGLLIFARDAHAIRDLELAAVGTGTWDMGNKGGVGARFKYHVGASQTELTFVAAHLAAHEPAVEKRNANWRSIVRGLVFSSSAGSARGGEGEERPLLNVRARDAAMYKPTSHLFLAGDLNYRTSTISPAPEDHKTTFPQPHKAEDDEQHFMRLFKDDQLTRERKAKRTCHGLTEETVTFEPTYKYIEGSNSDWEGDVADHWTWASHRWPSWCDRILYLATPAWSPETKVTVGKYAALPLLSTTDHRGVTLEVSVPVLPIPEPGAEVEEEGEEDPRVNPPFDIDVDWKTKREKARRLEIATGLGLYLTTTAEGAGMLAAVVVGAVGAWFVLSSILLG